MAEDKPRLARLTAILTQLQSKRLITARDIAEKHGVSIRTVYRDIRTLEQSGIPIFTEEGKGYSIIEGFHLPPVMFSEEEANAIITAEQIISKNKDSSLSKNYTQAVEKLKSVLQFAQKDKAELLSKRIHVRNAINEETKSSDLIKLQSAITNFKLVDIEYTSLQDKTTQRKIEPFALIHSKERWIMIAYCRLRADFRAFRLDCISKMTALETQFEPHDMTLEEYFKMAAKKWDTTPDIPLTPPGANFDLNQKKIVMQNVKIENFKVIGISIKTSNQNGQSATDIPQLWGRFMSENTIAKIPNKLDNNVLCMYTNYEGDHTQPYDTIIGCKVENLDTIPPGMVGQSFEGGAYAKITAKGDLTQGVIYGAWEEIWSKGLPRKFSADFEIYGEKSINPKDAEVDIMVALKG